MPANSPAFFVSEKHSSNMALDTKSWLLPYSLCHRPLRSVGSPRFCIPQLAAILDPGMAFCLVADMQISTHVFTATRTGRLVLVRWNCSGCVLVDKDPRSWIWILRKSQRHEEIVWITQRVSPWRPVPATKHAFRKLLGNSYARTGYVISDNFWFHFPMFATEIARGPFYWYG